MAEASPRAVVAAAACSATVAVAAVASVVALLLAILAALWLQQPKSSKLQKSENEMKMQPRTEVLLS